MFAILQGAYSTEGVMSFLFKLHGCIAVTPLAQAEAHRLIPILCID